MRLSVATVLRPQKRVHRHCSMQRQAKYLIIIQKIISLVFIIGFPFSLIFISHFQIPIIFINDFSSSIFNEFSIINISHFSSSLIFINHFFHPIFIHKNAHFSLIFQAISSIFINSFGITVEIFSLVNTSHFCSAISIINLCLQVTFASPLFKS